MNYNAGQSSAPKPPAAAMTYICAECGSENEIKPKEPIRCKECGYRIMYKRRTKRSTFSFVLFVLSYLFSTSRFPRRAALLFSFSNGIIYNRYIARLDKILLFLILAPCDPLLSERHIHVFD
ncbi:DNA directed RNA polymerase [Lobosporangium transversale]|uniref:DNA directed RNA polymerase n=1 Tax=Lobosporangium transversale TaxID=64571 RepID=A0A1Y2GFL9_9FUNG|nr:DNA directed RNA polymerase [Lobosporangium transversale]ORZ08065.1 DNA directed RNA polymerase [Lobosporangium transversale]|eukprot:XP_021878299.1 DNA directed RNA polymerase [Lobosporangium transversale]